MPAPFSVTPQDLLRSKTVAPTWYEVEVKKIKQEASKKDGATNTIVDVVVVGTLYDGVPIRTWFSEKAPGLAAPFIAACQGMKELPPDGGQWDLEAAVGKHIMAFVKNEEYMGRMTNKIADWKPV